MMDLRVAAAGAAIMVGACQFAPPPAADVADVALYQYAGSRQCERGGKTLETLKDELSAAGVPAGSASCGHDGRMYAQACGMPDGRILVVRVPQAHAAAAGRLGLKPLRDLPDAAVVACR